VINHVDDHYAGDNESQVSVGLLYFPVGHINQLTNKSQRSVILSLSKREFFALSGRGSKRSEVHCASDAINWDFDATFYHFKSRYHWSNFQVRESLDKSENKAKNIRHSNA